MAMSPELAKMFRAQSKKNQDNLRRTYDDLNKVALKGQILFTGSSLMEQFPINEIAMSFGVTKTIYNRGVGGTTTDDFLAHIHTVLLDLAPGKIFINIGTNDIAARTDGTPWQQHLFENYEKILTIIQTQLPEAEVYMMAYYPINATLPNIPEWTRHTLSIRTNEALNETNQKLAALAEKYGYHFIDCNENLKDADGNQRAEFSKDGMHMFTAGYVEVFKALQRYL